MWIGIVERAFGGRLSIIFAAFFLLSAPTAAATQDVPASRKGHASSFELPFRAASRWVVVPAGTARAPNRTNAWAVNFAPLDRDESVLAPAAGRVRLIDMRPPMSPTWCDHDAEWSGPQREVQIELRDGWTVVVGFLDNLVVAQADEVVQGQELGELSRSGCGGSRAIQVVLWRSEANGVRSEPFGMLSGYRDDELYPGREVVGSLAARVYYAGAKA